MIFAKSNSLLRISLLPLWIGFFLIAAVPFLSILRIGPLPSYFLEAGSLSFILLFVLLSCACLYRFLSNEAFSGSFLCQFPTASYYFLILAAFWAVQARIMKLDYIGLNDIVAGTFLIYALLAWACQTWLRKVGQETVVEILAAILVIATVLQSIVGWLQYTGLAVHFSGLLMYRSGIVEGQLAQRNHLGHYLMWGILATAFLWAQRRLTAYLALPILLFISATMGLTGSRTIFGYILALAVLLPLWRLFSGRSSARLVWTLTLAALIVLACQFAIEPVLNLFKDNTMTSAAERLSSNAFGHSGRDFEWHKAWQTFLSAPWFGHGWGSYALQGFLHNNYPSGFRPYETNVLFTHSHNSLLNLLAEMGIIGTVLVLGGLLWCIAGCLKIRNNASLFLLAALSTSLVHSFLEYPLWYIYFLSVFALFISLFPNNSKPKISGNHTDTPKYIVITIAMFSIYLLTDLIRLSFVYQELLIATRQSDSYTTRQRQQQTLLRIARSEPKLQYYAEMSLLGHININSANLPDWAEPVSRRVAHFRPYANAHIWGLVAYRSGKTEQARDWMEHVYRYYPSKIKTTYAFPIMNTPYYVGLQQPYRQTCLAYYQSLNQAPDCPKAKF